MLYGAAKGFGPTFIQNFSGFVYTLMTTAGSLRIHQMSDAGLVIAIGRWVPEALQEAYRRNAGPVWALANRLLGDRSRAEDVTQEIFLDLWKAPEKYDPSRGSLRTYLLTRTHSKAVDLIRSETSRRRREDTDIVRMNAAIDDLEREVLDVAMAAEVKKAFEELPENEKTVIELAYFKGHTYRETARLLNEPEGTVKSRIRSALVHLRSLIPVSVEDS